MRWSVLTIPRGVRRRLKKMVQQPADYHESRRALAILLLWENRGNASRVARTVRAARSSVNRWRGLKATERVLKRLATLVESSPQAYGYLRSRWSSELLARELARQLSVCVHAPTIRRWLSRLNYRYRRARPTLHIRGPRKPERIRAINRVLKQHETGTEVFFVDEADVGLNPRIGPNWSQRGRQRAIPTPGQNVKHYLAGVLHARSGKVLWTDGPSKSTDLFLSLLERLRARYRAARQIVVILDNYGIHKSRIARAWLAHNPKFKLLFQPTYHPWVNDIEKLWKQLHDTVTRNHAHRSMSSLMKAVRVFLHQAQPFPGADYADARLIGASLRSAMWLFYDHT